MLKPQEEKLIKEIWQKSGEQLEMVPEDRWETYLAPLLVRLLIKEREMVEYLTRRLSAISGGNVWD